MEQRSVEFRDYISGEKSDNQKFDLDSRNLKFFKEDIFHVPFDELSDSSSYKHFKHVFVDEDDYEDFKQDLINFHQLRSRWKDDRKKVSKERPKWHSLLDIHGTEKSGAEENKCKTFCVEQTLEEQVIYKNIDSDSDSESEVALKGHSRFKEIGSILGLELDSVPMMEFFQNDEHFQEFDRVFETVKNKRRYASNSSLDKYKWSPHQSDDNKSDSSDSETEVFDELKVDDIFSDFFDNDDDFKMFEEEFEKFQHKRRSRTLEKWHRNSVCDLIEDLKAFCDSEDAKSSTDKTNLPCDNKLSLPKLWNQGGEWDYIFSKIRKRPGIVSSINSDTGKSDLTVTCDSESGNNLLDDLSDSCNGDTGYYSELQCNKGNDKSCTCNCVAENDCQYTCHHKCLPLIQLECKNVSQDQDDEGAVLLGNTTLSDLSNTNISSQSTELSSEPASEKDETDSGYRSGTIPDEKLPPKPSDATLNREELKKKIAEFNKCVPGANFALREEEDPENKDTQSFQGFIKVTLNLVRPISMSLGARPPSIYEVLTQEHIVEQNTQNISFYMPRDTIRSIHAHSSQTTKEVVTLLLKKFHILDHPRKFALYEQELKNNKIARLRRVKDGEYPLAICLSWDLDNAHNHRLVLQENETGEIDWEAFCTPELNNFLRVLDREEEEYMAQLKYKYKVMKRLILTRMKELRQETEKQKRRSMVNEPTS
ncbi:uncharacterized protein LOC123528701 [Mercenaria mercenaria]|uniref:uncharacterized protein LOC123528701 n=1 Tax=Mercenaria mercenaria TaxID=6596 RepID=UPI00234F5EF6|nr:uncharacterized protein LOC123528701 [Mercenaria mercenaria]XP_045164576.2 uncharacterized protein LOC123528701 [Mercenaria mercenaria]XP_053377576.1 uncharacterized protein LOC123528701 [Mercenaria mercenaria]XP_053377577.1 uncharacterized protein LOC123528701 [Mercenaria mercenaria]